MKTKTLMIAIAAGLVGSSLCQAEVRVTMTEALKAATSKVQPDYSPIARQMKVGGRVELEVSIDTDGSVSDVKVVSGNPLLTPNAVSAVKKWKFTPFETNGQPAKAIATIAFNFQQ